MVSYQIDYTSEGDTKPIMNFSEVRFGEMERIDKAYKKRKQLADPDNLKISIRYFLICNSYLACFKATVNI